MRRNEIHADETRVCRKSGGEASREDENRRERERIKRGKTGENIIKNAQIGFSWALLKEF